MTLHVHNATAGYDGTPVIENVTVDVEAGELLGLLGPNGSGKTTLLQAIDGLNDLREGRISLDGTDVTSLTREEIGRKIGYLPQVEGASPSATVFDTVLLGRMSHFDWRPTDEDRRAVKRVLDHLGIADLALREVPTLSGGQRRTVLLARALVGDPNLLLLDEPTSGLDLNHQHDVMGHVRSALQTSGRAGVVAIHDLDIATRYCDRFVLLADGQVHARGGEEVLTPETIEDVYGVPVEVFTRNGRTHIAVERAKGAGDIEDCPDTDIGVPDPVTFPIEEIEAD